MAARSPAALGAIVLFACAFPARATAGSTVVHGGDAAQTLDPTAPGYPAPRVPGAPVTIDERFSRDVAPGCEYVGVLRGQLRSAGPAAAPRYDANLRVVPEIRCDHGDPRALPPQSVTARHVTREDLERIIESQGSVRARVGSRVCTYAPRVTVADGTVRGEALTESCREARGGGPPGAAYSGHDNRAPQ